MTEVWISIPRSIDLAEMKLPERTRPHGFHPHWCPHEFICDFLTVDEAQEFLDRMRQVKGVCGRIRKEYVNA